jgi:hypothetical protein
MRASYALSMCCRKQSISLPFPDSKGCTVKNDKIEISKNNFKKINK